MTESVTAVASAATASAGTAAPRVWVKTGTIAAGAVASAAAPTVIVAEPIAGPSAALVYMLAQPHYHLPADHDPIALATDIALVLVVLFVGWKLVACRLMYPASWD
jgi:hypothetical protein